jgi:chaperonin GroES
LKLKPAPDRYIVQEDAFKYEGRIIVPDKAQRRPTTGTVVAVGALMKEYKIGDRVLYAQFSGTGINLKNQPAYRILNENEILCTIEGDVEIEEVSA